MKRIEELKSQRLVDERPIDSDDAYTATVTYESGATGTFEASHVAAGHKNDHTIEIHGTEGSLRFSLERLDELEVNHAGSRGYETILVTDEADPYIEHWWPPGHIIGWEHTFVHESWEFLTAIANNEPIARTNLATFDQATDIQRLVRAVQASSKRGAHVTPAEIDP